MRQFSRTLATAMLVISACLALAQSNVSTADEMFDKINKVGNPPLDQEAYKKDPDAYLVIYQDAIKQANNERNKLILDFYNEYPEDKRLPALMEKRWMAMHNDGTASEGIVREINSVSRKVSSEEMTLSSDYCRLVVQLNSKGFDIVGSLQKFAADHKGSPRIENVTQLAIRSAGKEQKKTVLEFYIDSYPDNKFTPMYKGQIRAMDALGKPFELKFKDAVTGKQIDMKQYRGKVVMIDWWATWCGPCIQELPHVKKVYEKYKDKGFEIIGVSLDQPVDKGGLDALKDFVADNDMPWAQYYMGNYWYSEFSMSWGIMSIPSVFLIDQKGNLVEMNVTDLEKSIKELLKIN